MEKILNWKLFLFVASLLLSSLSFVACDPDKEDEDTDVTTPTYKELIIGKWGVNKVIEERLINGEIESSDTLIYDSTSLGYLAITFTNNGKAITVYGNNSSSDTIDYYVLNNDLYLTKEDSHSTLSIKTLNSSSLNLYLEQDFDNGYTSKRSLYFSKISK
ncbi:MAG: hypothetical protein H6Q15_1590 [Bacteroidetes bacterium]|nr:hypothetical protein [Bacteroidota bacterium]